MFLRLTLPTTSLSPGDLVLTVTPLAGIGRHSTSPSVTRCNHLHFLMQLSPLALSLLPLMLTNFGSTPRPVVRLMWNSSL